MLNPLNRQVNGHHYRNFVIQPVEFIHKNKIGFIAGNIIKYACRYEKKGQLESDLKKIIHYAELLIQLEKK